MGSRDGGIVLGWRLPEIVTAEGDRLGPGFGYGVGCGVGLGVGVIGGVGIGSGFPGLSVAFGIGAGCGVGIGYGYAAGRGRAYDRRGSYSSGRGLRRRSDLKRGDGTPLADTELGRMLGDAFQEITSLLASFGKKD